MLSLCEQETIITFDEEESTLNLYTASSRVKKHMDKQSICPSRTFNSSENKPVAWEYVLPKNLLRIKPGNKSIYIGGYN